MAPTTLGNSVNCRWCQSDEFIGNGSLGKRIDDPVEREHTLSLFVSASHQTGLHGLGLSGTDFDDVFNLTMGAEQWMQVRGRACNDTFNVDADLDAGGLVRLDYSASPSGIFVHLPNGKVYDDGNGDEDTINGDVWQIRGPATDRRGEGLRLRVTAPRLTRWFSRADDGAGCTSGMLNPRIGQRNEFHRIRHSGPRPRLRVRGLSRLRVVSPAGVRERSGLSAAYPPGLSEP